MIISCNIGVFGFAAGRPDALKMRLYNTLLAQTQRSARKPQREPVPLQVLLPLELKNKVSNKGEKTRDLTCLQELGVMLACLKKNEFDQVKCSPEITTFQTCYKSHKQKVDQAKETSKLGILVPGATKLTNGQVNTLLKRFPAKTRVL